MSYIIVGASAGVGRAIARELAGRGNDLILVASSREDLDAAASDLALRFKVNVSYIVQNLDGALDTGEFYRKCFKISENVDGIVFTAGYVSDSDCGQIDEQELSRIVNVNLKAILLISNRFITYFQKRDRGVIVAFSSVAAARGRKANMVYGAMKRGLEAYFEALRHLFAASNVRVQLYKLGYVETQMSFGRKLIFPIAKPEAVAREVCGNLDKDFGCKYYPSFWKAVIFVLRRVPWMIFRKSNF